MSPGPPPTNLPTGLVTFVFSDIEGSTRILKRLPDTAAGLFDRHNDLVRLAIAQFGGVEVSTEGDSFFVAFDDVDSALATCALIQQLLADEPWPEGGAIRVRIGVHSGVAAPRNGSYVALAVHQAARIVSVAHGGQIVVSAAVADASTRKPPGRLRPLGRFRVRDFDEPELLYRFDPDGAPLVDRLIRATPAEGHNLIKPVTAFFGRGAAADALTDLISTDRIVSIVGPGGIGKTRLATEIGLEQAPSWPDGVWMVELADLASAGLIPSAFADAVGVNVGGASDVWGDVLAWARDRRSLLIVDNLESWIDECATLLDELIRLPGIAIVTTSREPLNVAAEMVYRLGPLDVPGPDASTVSARHSPAVALFIDRARRVQPTMEFSAADVEVIAELCARLDGLPLAIEIAAARVGVMSVDELLSGLSDRFRLLRSNERTRPQRQRTLVDLLGWSYDLLNDDEQRTLRRLAVFGGSFEGAAAVAAVGAGDLRADDVAELVWSLVDKSLVVPDPSKNGTRYRLLESIREFAFGLLVAHGEVDGVTGRVGDNLLGRVAPWFTIDRHWISETAVEVDNIRSVIHRAPADDQERAQALAVTLGRYHDATQTFETGIRELDDAVERLTAGTSTRVVLLTTLADLHLRRGEIDPAVRLLRDAEALTATVGPSPWSDVAIDRTRGDVFSRQRAHADAVEVAIVALARPGLSALGRARMSNLLGISLLSLGDLPAAFEAFRCELELYEELGVDANVASANSNLAETAFRLDDRYLAAVHQQASLDLALTIGQPVMLAYSTIVAAQLAAVDDEWVLALRLLGAGQAGLHDAGILLYDADQAVVDRLREQGTGSLGDARAADEVKTGSALGIIEAARLARDVFANVIRRETLDQSGTPHESRIPDERKPT